MPTPQKQNTPKKDAEDPTDLDTLSEEELVARMIDEVDNMDINTFDPACLDKYMIALEKIAPLNLEIDLAAKKAEFWEQHADLIRQAFPNERKPPRASKPPLLKRLFTRC